MLAPSAPARYGGGVPQTMPPKKDVARALLLRGSVFVHLDPRIEGMSVPQWLKNQPQLVLQIGLDMPIPIPDLRVDDEGVYGTLSFQRSPFTCRVPWTGVFALVGEDGRGMVWPEDLPSEIAAEVEREVGRKEPALRAVEGGRNDDASDADAHDNVRDLAEARDRERRSSRASHGLHGRGKKHLELPPYLRIIK